jgi:hypothetical protein
MFSVNHTITYSCRKVGVVDTGPEKPNIDLETGSGSITSVWALGNFVDWTTCFGVTVFGSSSET